MTTINAKVLADSINLFDDRLTTLVCEYPRVIHSEVLTHAMLRRNAASSRAIPINRLIGRVLEDPFVPEWWGANEKGMQANDEIPEDAKQMARVRWLQGRDSSVALARDLGSLGLHKQIANRVIEPWMNITIIVSATDWDNFLALRCHPMAEPHFQRLASAILDALNGSVPVVRQGPRWDPRAWHLPLVTEEERLGGAGVDDLLAMAAGRCTRVSFLNHDLSSPTLEGDRATYQKLMNGDLLHASPLEHVCRPMADESKYLGPFKGWIQHRKEFPHENVTLFPRLRRWTAAAASRSAT